MQILPEIQIHLVYATPPPPPTKTNCINNVFIFFWDNCEYSGNIGNVSRINKVCYEQCENYELGDNRLLAMSPSWKRR